MANTEPARFYSKKHDHRSCIYSAINKAETICSQSNARFTPLRKRILELIWLNHKPVLAYDLLKSLRNEKHNAEAPTVYRALDFLMNHHLIHKIESMNAYVGCQFPDQPHISQFLICSECDQFAEIKEPAIEQVISRQAKKLGFKIAHQTIELSGVCPQCSKVES